MEQVHLESMSERELQGSLNPMEYMSEEGRSLLTEEFFSRRTRTITVEGSDDESEEEGEVEVALRSYRAQPIYPSSDEVQFVDPEIIERTDKDVVEATFPRDDSVY